MSETHEHTPSYYVKIWAILLGLLIISIAGPMIGIKAVTLITAFGIALVKAYMVASRFMHLNIEKKYISYLLIAMVAIMVLFFAGTAPDVMKPHGKHWEKNFTESPLPAEHSESH